MKSHNLNYQLFNQNCNSKFLILCDHATNRIPEHISKTQLGLTDEQLEQHIAFDLGAKGTAIELSKNLSAPLITSNFSRLVIDPNRSTKDPTSVMQIYDGIIIRGNLNLSKTQLNCRRKNFYDPYHKEISSFIENKIEGKILGPVNAPLFRLKRKFRIRFLIRGSKSMKLQSSLAKIIPNYKFSSGIKLSVDVDPINFN